MIEKVVVDNIEILDISLGLYDNVFVRVRDIDGYEYAGELTGIMDESCMELLQCQILQNI